MLRMTSPHIKAQLKTNFESPTADTLKSITQSVFLEKNQKVFWLNHLIHIQTSLFQIWSPKNNQSSSKRLISILTKSSV